MKLWILTPVNGDQEVGPWKPWYDKAFGFIVAAPDVKTARALAAEACGDEGSQPWLDPSHSFCKELTAGEDAVVVMRDLWRA